MSGSPGAVLDACVLVPAATRDTLLRAAEAGLYPPLWSEAILAELERTLGRLFAARNLDDAARRVQHLLDAFAEHFLEAIVSGHEHLIPSPTNDPRDRHVLAAAIAAKSRYIVTENLRDFPEASLAPHRINVIGADGFLLKLFSRSPEKLCAIIELQGQDRNPPSSVDAQLHTLARQLPGLASAIRQHRATD